MDDLELWIKKVVACTDYFKAFGSGIKNCGGIICQPPASSGFVYGFFRYLCRLSDGYDDRTIGRNRRVRPESDTTWPFCCTTGRHGLDRTACQTGVANRLRRSRTWREILELLRWLFLWSLSCPKHTKTPTVCQGDNSGQNAAEALTGYWSLR